MTVMNDSAPGKEPSNDSAALHGATLITTAELAAYLGASLQKVYRMARAGEIPSIKIGRHYRFDRDAVVAKLTAPARPWSVPARSLYRRRRAI